MPKERAAPAVTRQRAKQTAVAPAVQQKTRKIVNINAIYDAPQSLKRKRLEEEDDVDTFVPPVSNRKPLVVEPGFFTKHMRQQEQRPAAPIKGFFKQYAKPQGFGFGDAFKTYGEAADASFEERWATFQQELKACEEGDPYDEDGNPLEAPIPTDADIEALRQKILALNKPLEEELIHVNFSQPDGTNRTKEVRLGHTLDTFGKKSEESRLEVIKISKKLAKVEKEMEALKQELERDVAKEEKGDDAEFVAQMKAYEEEIEKIDEQAEAQRRKFEKEEKAAKKEFNRKLEELMGSL